MNKKIGLGIVGIIVLAGVFYGGMIYGGNNVRAAINSRSQGAQIFGQNSEFGGGRGGRGGGFGGGAGGNAFGQIISKDASSITIQLMGGGANSTSQVGSKIILLDPSTKITKQANGTLSDLAVGTNVSVSGTANTDGSISAQNIQIRPNMPQGAKVQ